MGLDWVLADLENEGYTAQAFLIPACAVGANHRRDRVWIVAHSQSEHDGRDVNEQAPGQEFEPGKGSIGEDVAHAKFGVGSMGRDLAGVGGKQKLASSHFDIVNAHQPGLCGKHDGVPGRVDRLKQLGNAVVPQVVEVIGKAIMGARV